MTTENGLPQPREVRNHIGVLQERCDYLADKLAMKILEKPEVHPDTFYEAAEIRALQWAIPVLEAEFGAVLRIHRDIIHPAEALLEHMDGQEQRRVFGRHQFAPDPVDAEKPWRQRRCSVCGIAGGRHLGARRPEHEVSGEQVKA